MMIYYIGASVLLLSAIVLYLTQRYALRKKSVFIRLFNEALRQENNGDFEAALLNYGQALTEAGKMRYDYGFKNKIAEKLKVLHTVIDYGSRIPGRELPESE